MEARSSSSSDGLTGSSLLTVETLDRRSNPSPTTTGSNCGDDVARKNIRNYQNCVSTSPTVDRTPSPNILDLLDGGSRVPKQRREPSESDGEKEVAEISDEKIREDLEVGNVSAELLRRICDEVVSGSVVLPTVAPPRRLPDVVDLLALPPPENVPGVDAVSLAALEDSFNELFERSLPGWVSEDRMGFRNDGPFLPPEDKPAKDSDWKRDKFAEDSNKMGLDGGAAEEKGKASGSGAERHQENPAGEFPAGGAAAVSRKLILDKIETEKRRGGRRRRSGSGARLTGLTSEEFDELYRLPTEHLRKDRERNSRERSSRASVDRGHRHRHHSHDSYSGRHALTDDCRNYRGDNTEGACGGTDYYCYDDMAMSHHLDSEPDSAPPPQHVRLPLELSAGSFQGPEEFPDAGPAQVGFPRRRCGLGGRDNSSSPESPVGLQAGARPKKSPKKHRAS